MGQIKKQRKKYNTPTHPWQAERLQEETDYVNKYGFKNKKEIWKIIAKLENYKDQVKKIIASKGSEQMQKEKEQLMTKLLKYGLITKDSKLEDILELSPKDLMDLRLQTVVFKKNLAKSLKQARQFIVHGHVTIANKKLTVPSYLVSLQEESKVRLSPLIPVKKEEVKQELKEKKQVKEDKKEEVSESKYVEEKVEKKVPTAAELKEKQEETKVEA
tara:strand:+ start:4641 stop:5288 length:648 start_codon:yes stop_codon:yes gene_type:complete